MDGYRLLAWNGTSYTELVVDNEFNISINFELGNVLEPTVNSGVWSKESSLPDDPINNAFFDNIWRTDYLSTGFNPKKGIKAQVLTTGGQKIKDCFIIVKDIDYLQKNKRVNFELYSTQKSFFNDIDGHRLRELDFSEYNHIRNRENIILSHTYSIIKNGTVNYLTEPGDGYIYPSIVYGNTSNFYKNYNIYDLYPGFYTRTILKKIVEFTGRKFKDSELTKSLEFKMDFLPFTNEKLEMSEEALTDRASIIGITDDYALASGIHTRGSNWGYYGNLPGFTRESGTVDDEGQELIFSDNLSQFNNDVAGAFYCKNNGYYNIKFNAHGVLELIRYDGDGNPDPGEPINYNEGSGTFEAEVSLYVIRLNGTHQQLAYNLRDNWAPSTGEYPSPWIDDGSTQLFSLEADNILLTEGEVVYVKYGFRYPGDVNWGPPAFNDRVRARLRFKKILSTSFSKFTVKVANTADMGNNMINMNDVLPDMEFSDFISSLKNMYNMIITDDGEYVSFESYDKYFDYDAEDDWNDIWEEAEGYNKIPMSEVDFSQYKLSYEKDEDMYNKEYYDSTNNIYGNKILSIVNDRSEKKYEKKLSFASTPVSTQYSPVVQPYFTERNDGNLKAKKVKPRILKYGGLIDIDYIIIQDYPGPNPGDFTVLNKYPYCGMWDHPFDPTYSLEFDAPSQYYYSPVSVPRLNLFNKYHKNAINNIINNDSALYEAMFYLSDKQIVDFDFRKKINWLGGKWRVNKIMDYNPGQSSKLTKVQLYRIVESISPDSRNVSTQLTSNSCPVDVIAKRTRGRNYIYVSESGQEISESCCDLMGGTYKNGVCYAGKEVPFLDGVVGPFLPNVSTPNPTGPISWVKDGNSILSDGIIVRGNNNYVPAGMSSSSAMILGSNNTLQPNFVGLAIGDGIFATVSGLQVGTLSNIDLNGNITTNSINVENLNGYNISDIISSISGGSSTRTIGTYSTTSNITTDVALAYTNTSSLTLYLPTAVGITGSEYTIKDRSGNAKVNNIIVSGTSSQTIDGSSTYTMRLNYESITVISDGLSWWII